MLIQSAIGVRAWLVNLLPTIPHPFARIDRSMPPTPTTEIPRAGDPLASDCGAAAGAGSVGCALPAPESLFQGASVTLGAGLLSMGIGLVNNIVLARILGPEFKGRVDLINSAIGLMTTLTGCSLAVGLTYVIAKGQANQGRLALVMFCIAVIQSAVAWLVLAGLARTSWITALVPLEYAAWAVPVLAIGTWAGLLVVYWRAFLAGAQRFTACAVLDVAGKLLIVMLMLAGAVMLRATASAAAIAAILGLVAANVITAVAAPAWLAGHFRRGDRRVASPVDRASGLPQVIAYSVPCYVGNVVQSLNYRLDVFLIAYIAGARELGLYMIAVAVGQLLWLPSQAMQAVLFPRLSSITDDASRARQAAQVARVLLAFTVIFALALGLLGPYLVVWLFGTRFSGSIVPLWLLLPGIAAFTVTHALAAFFNAVGRPSLNLAVAAVGLVATVALNLILLPRIGIAGAAIASSVSYSISALLLIWIFCRWTRYPLLQVLLPQMSDVRVLLRRLGVGAATDPQPDPTGLTEKGFN